MVSPDYLEYLKTPEWQHLRSERLKIDGYKCQRCGRPFDLDVHHTSYPSILGTEDPYADLITLCRHCHNEIEDQKALYKEKQAAEIQKYIAEAERQRQQRKEEYRRFNERLTKAIHEKEHLDISNVGTGKLDLCNIEVIKSEFASFAEYEDSYGYVMRVQIYFRNKRYKIILDMMDKGYTQKQVIQNTGFSYNMVRKVFDKPLNAIKILEKEKKDNEQA